MNSTQGSWEMNIYYQRDVTTDTLFWAVNLYNEDLPWEQNPVIDLENFDYDKLELTGETLQDLVLQALEFVKGAQK